MKWTLGTQGDPARMGKDDCPAKRPVLRTEKLRELPTAVQLHRSCKVPLIALRAPNLSLHPCALGERGSCGVGVWSYTQPLLFKVGKGGVGVRPATEKHLEFFLQ